MIQHNATPAMTCPLPLAEYPHVLMAHGGGGRLSARLIEELFGAAFGSDTGHDGVVLDVPTDRVAMSTDSFVVRPLFFPGGDIGMLAVNGTVNDLAMCGARPRYLSAGFILEEGLPMATLWRIAQSMRAAADAAEVRIVTGDTKVVERGHGDGIYINTCGIGVLEHTRPIGPAQVTAGDVVLLSGAVGHHGMAVMAQRESLSFSSLIESDCAPLAATVMALLDRDIEVHCLRDATRGGLAAVLNEIARTSGLQVDGDEMAIPVDDSVRSACEILGIDPMQVANEGCFVAFIAANDAPSALELMRRFQPQAAVIGEVVVGKAGLVTLKTSIGGRRILDLPAGELLPRIC
ncbi:MAG: hydrogenase expression/formation protein HypE [Pseudomonadales bacterium]|nr:hydrogenase expression/formation protein HypE [Pseudomonadales bacterium]